MRHSHKVPISPRSGRLDSLADGATIDHSSDWQGGGQHTGPCSNELLQLVALEMSNYVSLKCQLCTLRE